MRTTRGVHNPEPDMEYLAHMNLADRMPEWRDPRARRKPRSKSLAEKVLCVDDEVNILLSLQRQLRKQFHLESALGPEKALASIEHEGPYAVVVSDLQMPGMNGLELLARSGRSRRIRCASC